MSALTCQTCRYWNRLDHEDAGRGVFGDGGFATIAEGTGECRLRPPPGGLAFDDSGDAANAAAWPITWGEHWCGSFQQKAAPKPKFSRIGY